MNTDVKPKVDRTRYFALSQQNKETNQSVTVQPGPGTTVRNNHDEIEVLSSETIRQPTAVTSQKSPVSCFYRFGQLACFWHRLSTDDHSSYGSEVYRPTTQLK